MDLDQKKTYNVGIIGFGFMGKVHTYAYRNMPMYYDALPFRVGLRGVCTTHIDGARRAVDTYGFDRAYDDWRMLIRDPNVDIINICTPNHLHREQLIAALEAGKHVYCEKPLCVTVDEADEIQRIADASASHVTTQLVFHNRFFPATLKAKELMPTLGRILSFRCRYLHSGNLDLDKPVSWKQQRDVCGGGVLYDLGSHAIDMIHWLVGDFKRVQSVMQTAYPARLSTDEATYVIAEMDCGAVGTIEVSKIAAGNDDVFAFEINGECGAIRFDSMRPNWLEHYDASAHNKGFTHIDTVARYGGDATFPSPKNSIGWQRAHVHSLYSFMMNVHEGKQGCPSIADGAYVQRVIAAVERAANGERQGVV